MTGHTWQTIPAADLSRLPPGTRVRVSGREGHLRAYAPATPGYMRVSIRTDLRGLSTLQVPLALEVEAQLPAPAIAEPTGPLRVPSTRADHTPALPTREDDHR